MTVPIGHLDDGGDLLVGKILDLAQDEDLAGIDRWDRERRRDPPPTVAGQGALLRIRAVGRPVLVVERSVGLPLCARRSLQVLRTMRSSHGPRLVATKAWK